MTSRKDRKSRSKRGSRTHGGGSSKNRRHSGHKGGKGAAGSHKHLWMKYGREKNYFGKYGFKRPSAVKEETKTMNVGEVDENIEELLEEGLAEKEGDEILVDLSRLGIDKVLGGGKVTHPLRIKAKEFSEKAERKLEESGGTEKIGES